MPRRSVPKKWPTGLIEVAPNVYGYIQDGEPGTSNGGLLVGEEGSIAIDALFTPRHTRSFLRAIRKATPKPVRQLINTHHHTDHTGGNHLFPGAQIIAHTNCREEMSRSVLDLERLRRLAPRIADEMKDVPQVLPSTSYAGQMTLHLGRRTIQLLHLGLAHTAGDTLVYLPEERVLFAGDVAFHYVAPVAFDGHVSRWIKVADRIAALDVEVIVPGHGPIGTKAELQEMRDCLALVRRQARRSFLAGEPEKEAALKLNVGGYYAQWIFPERLPLLIRRLYMEFRGEI